MLPAERGEVGEQRVRHRLAAAAQGVERTAEIDGVPQRDGGGDQGEAAGAVLLRSAVRSRSRPSRWKHTARASALRASPLFSSAVACRRSAGCSSQSRVNSVRSMRPISRSASARPFCRG